MGKFGGCEINYHSDLDMVFLYETDGATFHARRSRRSSGETTTNQHFFSELGTRIIKRASQLGPHGRLYEIDPRLRPTGKSGSLATSLSEFRRYFDEGGGQLWERQALCKARVVYGSLEAQAAAVDAVSDCTYRPWQPSFAAEILRMRGRLEETCKPTNLKRGPGGLVDVEFIAQMLQLKHGREHPEVRQPATLDALSALHKIGVVSRDDLEFFSTSYRVLLAMVSRLRLMNTTARHDLPEDEDEQIKLARLLEYPDRETLLIDCEKLTRGNRERFDRIFAGESGGTSGGGI